MSDDAHVFLTQFEPHSSPGLRVAVKDCIDVNGVVTTAGCPVVARMAAPAKQDAACLAGVRAAGAHVVGKTNLHELCFGATGANPHYGTPVNPLDPTRIPGGSSSGSAVAVAIGAADIAFGTDTAGSIRNPAACCGVVGLKTTWGRIDVTGTRPLAPSMDTIGPLARDVAGVVAGMTLLEPGFSADADLSLETLSLGRLRPSGVDPRIDKAVDHVMDASGANVLEVDVVGWNQAHHDGRTLMFAEALQVNQQLVEDYFDELGDDVRERFIEAQEISTDDVEAVLARQEVWRTELAGSLTHHDALITAGYPQFPPRLDEADPTSSMTAVAVSFAGFPAICLPIPSRSGPRTANGTLLPASVQLIGRPGSEETLCAIAALVEANVGSGCD